MRQTGRTTKMLQAAAQAKLNGSRVMIVAPTGSIRDNIARMARGLGLDFAKNEFTTCHHVAEGRLRGWQGAIFEDHTVEEHATSERYRHEVEKNRVLVVEPVESETEREEKERLRLREELRRRQE